VNFARESNDLQVQRRAMLDETLDALLDVFSTVIREGIILGAGEERRIVKIHKHFKLLIARSIDFVGRNVGRFVGRFAS